MAHIGTTLLIALSLTACGAAADHSQDEPPVTVELADAGTVGTVEDAGTTEPSETEYAIGDPCFCCVWAPGTSYPNGDVYCLQGKVDILEGLMCRAAAGDGAPEWAPKSKGCVLDNPWGKPGA